MLDHYKTVSGYGSAALDINKSRFIAYVSRVETEDEAVAFIEQIKKKHLDATHHCAAYITGEHDQYQKAYDDGEPTGTAGKPILEVIKKSALKDTVIVVIRYFGGIKLGSGGLIRAYGRAASAGLQVAGFIERCCHTRIVMEFDYTFQGIVENNLRSLGYVIEGKEFGERVTMIALEKSGQEEILEKKITDWTAGKAILSRAGEVYVDGIVT
jgi:uncharacterized YigZ family protein